MKAIALLIGISFTLLTQHASAQIVNIPDNNFKIVLLQSCDLNGDGELQVSEALSFSSLLLIGIDANTAYDLTGIEAFQNLHSLKLYNWGTYFVHQPLILQLPSLNRLEFESSYFTNVDLRNCPQLDFLNLGGPDVINRSVNLSGLNSLDTIYGVGITDSLNVQNCSSLKVIWPYTDGDVREYLNLTGCVSLKSISFTSLGVSSLDLSTCTSGVAMNFISARNLVDINVKNGKTDSWVTLDAYFLNPVVHICADSFELNSFIQQMGYSTPAILGVSPYCSYYPGGYFNTIQGNVKIDDDGNGCNASDRGLKNVPLSFTDNFGNNTIRYTNDTGLYAYHTFTGNFTIVPAFNNNYFSISPTQTTVQFDTANNLVEAKNFCITAAGTHNDLDISVAPFNYARPGDTATYVIVIRNKGNAAMTGQINFNFDNNKESFANANLVPDIIGTNSLTWNYSNFLPFTLRTIYVDMNILAPPANNIGDTLNYTANITPINADETPVDNTIALQQAITNSMDPNDKLCLEGNKIDVSALNNPLHYMIRFQNTGTDTAFNIVVADTLTSNLDWNSFDFITSSHPCHVTRHNNKLEFYFENIHLPYQAINDAGSNGYVIFGIKPNNALHTGDSIINKASIYFDFNLPIVTANAKTFIVSASPVPVKIDYFTLNSQKNRNKLDWKINTQHNSVNISIERSADGIQFYELSSIMATAQRCQLPFNYLDEKPLYSNNYYRLKIKDENNTISYSKILLARNDATTINISNIISKEDNTNIYLEAAASQTIQLVVYSADGNKIFKNEYDIAAGNSKITLPLISIPAGVYTLSVQSKNGSLAKRFVKLR